MAEWKKLFADEGGFPKLFQRGFPPNPIAKTALREHGRKLAIDVGDLLECLGWMKAEQKLLADHIADKGDRFSDELIGLCYRVETEFELVKYTTYTTLRALEDVREAIAFVKESKGEVNVPKQIEKEMKEWLADREAMKEVMRQYVK